MSDLMYGVIVAGLLGLIYAIWRTAWINRQEVGTDKMRSIGASISEGAMAFLKAEYRVLAIFVGVVAVLLAVANMGKVESSALIALSLSLIHI